MKVYCKQCDNIDVCVCKDEYCFLVFNNKGKLFRVVYSEAMARGYCYGGYFYEKAKVKH